MPRTKAPEPFIVLVDVDGEDFPIHDSKAYVVTFSSKGVTGKFRGWFSAEQSTPYRLKFHGELAGDWVILAPGAIRDVTPESR
jgi:hypothetical protein